MDEWLGSVGWADGKAARERELKVFKIEDGIVDE